MQSRGGDKQGDMEEDHQPYQRPDTREEEDQSNAIHSTSVVATVDLEIHRPAGVSRGRSLQQRDGVATVHHHVKQLQLLTQCLHPFRKYMPCDWVYDPKHHPAS